MMTSNSDEIITTGINILPMLFTGSKFYLPCHNYSNMFEPRNQEGALQVTGL